MFGIPKVAIGAILVLVALLGGMGWWLSNVIESRGTLRFANKANLETIDRLEADAVIAQAVAIADAQARRKLETDHQELTDAADNASGGECAGLDAVIERRRLQRARDGNQGR